MSKVAIIGSGNVGFHFAQKISEKHTTSLFVRDTSKPALDSLSGSVVIRPFDELKNTLFDIIILAVPDQEISPLAKEISNENTLIVHTSGSRPLDDLKPHVKRGVVYPLQTFKIGKPVDFQSFPFFLEASDEECRSKLESFVRSFSSNVKFMDSTSRLKLHVAAVFACNFTNHMYRISDHLLSSIDLDFKALEHLALETLNNAVKLTPEKSQTGPAIRGDDVTIDSHKTMLEGTEKKIYELLSNSIRNSKQ